MDRQRQVTKWQCGIVFGEGIDDSRATNNLITDVSIPDISWGRKNLFYWVLQRHNFRHGREVMTTAQCRIVIAQKKKKYQYIKNGQS